MGIMHAQKAVQGEQIHLPNNPFVPPKGDVCYINSLPPELLSRIFEVGVVDVDDDDDDDDDNYLDNIGCRSLDMNDADEGNIHSDDVKMREEPGKEGKGKGGEGDDEGSDATGSSDFSWPSFQIVVSHVCCHWRNVALSTPSLWTSIDITPEDRPPYPYVSMLLERSKSIPIDIHVDCEPSEDELHSEPGAPGGDAPSESDIQFLSSLLVPHVHRWRTFELEVPEFKHMFVFLNALSDTSITAAPQLTTLQLCYNEEIDEFDNFGYPSMSKHFNLFGGVAPCLTHVVLWGVHVNWDQPWITSAPNLTVLELAYHPEDVRPSWVQFATILRGAPALEKFELLLSGPSGDPPAWFIEPVPGGPADLNDPIQLLKVVHLNFAFHSPERSMGLFRRFYLPALKHLGLDLGSSGGEYSDFVGELVGPATSLSPRSAQEQPRSLLNSLESLKIAGLPCRDDCIGALYLELQNLMELRLTMGYLSLVFFDMLCTPCVSPGRGDVYLPRLVTLSVSDVPGAKLREIVQKRREMGVPLEALFVEENTELDEEDVDWLKDNVGTFDFFERSDDEEDIDVEDFEDFEEEIDEWSDVD